MSETYNLFSSFYYVTHRKSVIVLKARDRFGRRKVFYVHGFVPYFYGVIAGENGFHMYDGKSAQKIEVKLPGDVKRQRDLFARTGEADVPFSQRYLIDAGITCGFKQEGDKFVPTKELDVEPRTLFIDIEVEAFGGVPDSKLATEPVYTIGCWDSYEEDFVQFVAKGLDVTSQRELLLDFFEYAKERDFDLISGWNVFFDIDYIISKAEAVHARYDNKLGRVNRGERWIDIAGCEVFDLLPVYKKFFQQTKFDSYALDFIYHKDFDKELLEYDYSTTGFDQIEWICECNKTHVMACAELDKRWNLIGLFDQIRRLNGCTYRQSLAASSYVDVSLLRRAHEKGFVLPTNVGRDEKKPDFGGGFVLEPPKGVFKNMAVLDFKKIYPSIIIGYNMSCETTSKVPTEDAYEVDGVWFKKEPAGIMPEMMIEFIERRNVVKEEMGEYEHGTPEFERLFAAQYALKQNVDCVPDYTQCITKKGIKNIVDLEIGDDVWSMNKGRKMEWKSITHKIYKGKGKLIKVQLTNGLSFKCSSNHHWVCFCEYKYVVKEANQLKEGDLAPIPFAPFDIDRKLDASFDLTENVKCKFKNLENGNIAFYHKNHQTQRTYKWVDVAELVAWFITEGSTYQSKKRKSHHGINIGQKEGLKKNEIFDLLEGMGINYSSDKEKLTVCNSIWYSFFTTNNFGKLAGGKTLPEWYKNLPNSILQKAFDVLVKGDGNEIPSGYYLNTISEKLADDYCYIATKLGFAVSVSKGKTKVGNTIYHVGCSFNPKRVDNDVVLKKIKTIEYTDEEADLYDVTVEDNHTIVWQNDTGWLITGQSAYGINALPAFRMYEPLISKSTTFMGRKFIKKAMEIVQRNGYHVAYVDTDSVLFSVGSTNSDDEARTLLMKVGVEMEGVVNAELEQMRVELGLAYPIEVDFELGYGAIQFKQSSSSFKQTRKFSPKKKKEKIAKKRYAGRVIIEDKKEVDFIKIRGMETRRSSSATVTREIQKELFRLILYGADRSEIKEFLRSQAERFRELPLEEFGIPRKMGMAIGEYSNPATVRSVTYSNEYLGEDIKQGQRCYDVLVKRITNPSWPQMIEVVVKGKAKMYPVDRVSLTKAVPEGITVDWNRQIRKIFRDKMESILDSTGIEWDEVFNYHKATTLGEWGA